MNIKQLLCHTHQTTNESYNIIALFVTTLGKERILSRIHIHYSGAVINKYELKVVDFNTDCHFEINVIPES